MGRIRLLLHFGPTVAKMMPLYPLGWRTQVSLCRRPTGKLPRITQKEPKAYHVQTLFFDNSTDNCSFWTFIFTIHEAPYMSGSPCTSGSIEREYQEADGVNSQTCIMLPFIIT
ncbi:hypothetical protein BTVI_105303 [Pitangus sulphuratus]|nr:hypothetical protein BTVI_105303 [Pitangus sulphuratus]